MKISEDSVVFESTEREARANCGLISIDKAGLLFQGYDGGFTLHPDGPLSLSERTELADFMIERWQAFRSAEIGND